MRLSEHTARCDEFAVAAELCEFVGGAFVDEPWLANVNRWKILAASLELVDAVLATLEEQWPSVEDALATALRILRTDMFQDPRVEAFFAAVRASALEEGEDEEAEFLLVVPLEPPLAS